MKIALCGARNHLSCPLTTSSEGGSGDTIKRRIVLTKLLLRTMKLTGVLILATCLHVAAKSVGQTITLSAKEVPLEKVFTEIIRQSGVSIIYNDLSLKTAKPVTIEVKNATAEQVLDLCLKGQPFSYTWKDGFIILKYSPVPDLNRDHKEQNSGAPEITPPMFFRGKILNEKREPFPGVSVAIKGTNRGVTSGADGSFSIKVNTGEIVVFSFIGYSDKEILWKGETSVTGVVIALELSTSPLDEIRIQAYGKTSQRLSVGTIATVKAADIEKQPVDNPLLALSGRVPGLIVTQTNGMPGARVDLQLRGSNSLTFGHNSIPLIIIDGVPVQNNIGSLSAANYTLRELSSLGFINSNDIASISVLKDADATSIYGSRGANGVILITSKKGQIGNSKIDVSLQSGWAQVARKTDFMNLEQFLAFRKLAYDNDGIDFVNKFPYNTSLKDKRIYASELFFNNQTDYTDWQDLFIGNTGQYNDFQGSISGGTATVQYRIGGNYHRQTSVFPVSSGDEKGTFTSNISGNTPNQKLKVSITTSYTTSSSKVPDNFTRYIYSMAPNRPSLTNPDGSINWLQIPNEDSTRWSFGGNVMAEKVNQSVSTIKQLFLDGNINYTLLKGLTLNVALGYNRLEGEGFNPYYIAAQNPYSAAYYGSVPTAAHNDQTITTKSFSIDPNINYTFQLGRNKFDITAGGTYSNQLTTTSLIFYSGYTSDAFIHRLEAATYIFPQNSSQQYRYNGGFARVQYNYNNKYLINLNARRDGSSRFGPGKQFGNFGSAGAAWIFSEEGFIRNNLSFLSFGKIRASYGTAGSDGVGDYQYFSSYYVSSYANNTYQGGMGLVTTGLKNPDFHWESTRKLEIGIDLGFLKDRILLNVNYYRNRSDNQLIYQILPNTAGYSSVVSNFPALLQNKGIELVLQTQNIVTKSFTWSSTLSVGNNSNKLIAFEGLAASPYAQQYVIGQPTNIIRAYKSAGVNPATGVYQFELEDGTITANPNDPSKTFGGRYININKNPIIDGMFTNNLSFHNFSISFDFQFRKVTGMSPYSYFMSRLGLSRNLPAIYLDYWKKPGDNTPLGKISATYSGTPDGGALLQGQDFWLQSDASYTDASFVRLRNVSVSWQVNDKLIKKMRMEKLRVFVNGQNLLTFTGYKGWDPEIQDYNVLPPLRVITVGVQATF